MKLYVEQLQNSLQVLFAMNSFYFVSLCFVIAFVSCWLHKGAERSCCVKNFSNLKFVLHTNAKALCLLLGILYFKTCIRFALFVIFLTISKYFFLTIFSTKNVKIEIRRFHFSFFLKFFLFMLKIRNFDK